MSLGLIYVPGAYLEYRSGDTVTLIASTAQNKREDEESELVSTSCPCPLTALICGL
jgi:hypothetical protein